MTDIKDLHIGDVITDGVRRYKVTVIDFPAGTVEGEFVGGSATKYLHTWAGPAKVGVWSWEQMGYDKENTAPAQSVQTPSGLLSWLPAPAPASAPAAPPNMGPLTSQTWTFTSTMPGPKKTRRQVSHNGKDWVDYRHLLDADDFESYTHRREV